jgi:hypothetical protein
MAASLATAARRSGLTGESLAVVERVHACAMAPRVATFDDDHHPAYLHPGRSALILLHDVGPVDPGVLVVAMLLESMDEELRLSRGAIVEALVGEAPSGAPSEGTSTGGALGQEAVFRALASVPMPGAEDIAERLVLMDPDVALAALAERLDHLRHLHMRPDRYAAWADTHAEITSTWLPFSHRIHPQLARRYTHWVRAFAKRT